MLSTVAFEGLIEFTSGFIPRPGITHVLFDFDGTLSVIREGWADVMLPMFMELVPPVPGESEDSRRRLCRDGIMRLNGKQTIYQMIQLAELIQQRGGAPREPLWYKYEFLRRLEARIRPRIEGLRRGTINQNDFLVAGARTLLEMLRCRGLGLYLASGTDEKDVKSEAELLGLTPYFGRHIYGAQDDYKKFSKQLIIERILRENDITGGQLLAFGDGYVEIENTKAAGGLAVGVASDEAHNGSGRFDEWKLKRLRNAGADLIVPDFRDSAALVERIFSVSRAVAPPENTFEER